MRLIEESQASRSHSIVNHHIVTSRQIDTSIVINYSCHHIIFYESQQVEYGSKVIRYIN